ncbi:MAG: SAM-dependent methyltransferase, partial [Bacteroidales bacterium]|nr:SAM-dependent methyltransferase [Bacteroidales bacterium]
KKSHRWLVLEFDNKLVLMDKEKYWFNTELDFGKLFLTWFQKNSLAYKILAEMHPNLFTVRYEWNEDIEFEINPESEKYRQYFNSYWNDEMIAQFFTGRSKRKEVITTLGSLLRISVRGALKRA